MDRRAFLLQAGLLSGATALAGAGALYLARRPRSRLPLTHEVFIWQRAWTPAVVAAVRRAAGSVAGYAVLAAEVECRNDGWNPVRVDADYPALASTGRPVALAVRVGGYRGDYAEVTENLAGLCQELLAAARRSGVAPTELQLDYDCPDARLAGYRRWLAAIRQRIDLPLVITALPSWLSRRELRPLLDECDGSILQVHSLDLPYGKSPKTLCDPASTCRWVEAFARFRRPFRVALPSYGYLIAYDAAGKFAGVAGEGPAPAWDARHRVTALRSDPAAMAALVHDWSEDRPANMAGIIWYRLPVDDDRLNWRWPTLSAVMAGRAPLHRLEVKVMNPDPPLAEIEVVNTGECDADPRVVIDLSWRGASMLAADGLRGAVVEATPTGARIDASRLPETAILPPGERCKLAWLRLENTAKVEARVVEKQPQGSK